MNAKKITNDEWHTFSHNIEPGCFNPHCCLLKVWSHSPNNQRPYGCKDGCVFAKDYPEWECFDESYKPACDPYADDCCKYHSEEYKN